MVAFLMVLLLQVDSLAKTVVPEIPSGFDFWYLPLFAAGMVLHFIAHVVQHGGGWKALTSDFVGQFTGWFFNAFHKTLLATFSVAIIGIATQVAALGINIGFATLNPLGVAASLAAGYIGDSAFNGGTTAPKV